MKVQRPNTQGIGNTGLTQTFRKLNKNIARNLNTSVKFKGDNHIKVACPNIQQELDEKG